MKYINIIIIILSIYIDSFGQNINIPDLSSGLRVFFLQDEFNSYLNKYAFSDTLSGTELKYYFVLLDSAEIKLNGQKLIDTIEQIFYTTNSEDFFFEGVSKWFELSNLECLNDTIRFKYRTMSHHKIRDIKYLGGKIELTKNKSNWYIQSITRDFYDYPIENPIDYCKGKTIKCSNYKVRELPDSLSFIYGDWQVFVGNDYLELFFDLDTLYVYSFFWGGFDGMLKYQITSDSNLILDFPSEDSLNFWQIKKIEPNRIELIWKEMIYGNSMDGKILKKEIVVAERLPLNVYKYSDVRCLVLK